MPRTEPNQSNLVSPTGYSELAREIRARGLLGRRPRYYLLLGGTNLSALALIVAFLLVVRDSWWLLLLAPVYAVVSAQIALFSHDASHRQIARGSRATAALGLFHGNLLNGFSYGWWVAKHNAHHAHPNDLESDPDVAVGAFVFDAEQAATRTGGVVGWLTRHQAGMFFPLLTLEAFNLRISSMRAVFVPGFRLAAVEGLLLLCHAAGYVALLVFSLTWSQGLLFLAVHQALFGVYLGCTFAPSHKGMPILSPEQSADPLLRQVLTSRNVTGGPALDLAMGGLNLQIEHHLFPSMPRPNLRLAQPIVARYCRDHGVSYAETSLLGCYRLALGHLHEVGAPLRARIEP